MKNTTKKPSSKKFRKRTVFETKKSKAKSPSISRSFTELKKGEGKILKKTRFVSLLLNKYFIVSFITTFLGVALSMQGVSVHQSLQALREIRQDRENIQKEVIYWEEIAANRPDYRDAFFKLTLLEYQLGNKEKAAKYLEKTLEIDPNYKPALDFRRELGVPYSL